MTVEQGNIKFKKLHLFFLSSAALIASGFMFSEDPHDWPLLLFLIYCDINGIFLVYRLNDCIDQDIDLKLNLKNFFSHKIHLWVVIQFFVVLIPASIILLEAFSFYVLGVGAILGFLYSITFLIDSKQFRIKNLFLIKNIAIGIVWGALILIGAGNMDSNEVLMLFGFTSLQVLIGSAIRDVPDVEKDEKSGVRSLPVVLE